MYEHQLPDSKAFTRAMSIINGLADVVAACQDKCDHENQQQCAQAEQTTLLEEHLHWSKTRSTVVEVALSAHPDPSVILRIEDSVVTPYIQHPYGYTELVLDDRQRNGIHAVAELAENDYL